MLIKLSFNLRDSYKQTHTTVSTEATIWACTERILPNAIKPGITALSAIGISDASVTMTRVNHSLLRKFDLFFSIADDDQGTTFLNTLYSSFEFSNCLAHVGFINGICLPYCTRVVNVSIHDIYKVCGKILPLLNQYEDFPYLVVITEFLNQIFLKTVNINLSRR